MTDMDQALRDYADRWQRAQEPTPVVAEPRSTSPRRIRLITGLTAAAAIMIAVAILAPGSSQPSRVRVGPAAGGRPVPSPTDIVPGLVPGARPSQPLRAWPTGPVVAGDGSANAATVADHFAETALGLADPQTTGPESPVSSNPEYLGIYLPATHRDLQVLAVPHGQVWAILQVGDGPPGVTLLPGDGTGPQASVTPPPSATHAEVSETLGSVVKTFSAGSDVLGAGVIHLIGVTSGTSTNLQELLIVYFDRSGQVVGATGGSYGLP